MENLATAIMGRDGSVWFTIKSLFTRPGEMIVDNLNGKRKKYFSPFPMLFCVLTLYILITSFTSGFFITQSLTEAEKEILQDDQSQADPKGVEAFQLVSRSVRFLSDHYTLCYLLTLPLLVLAARACFGKSNRKRYYRAEYIIAIVYASVIVVLFRCLVKLIYPFAPDLSMRLGFLLVPLLIIATLTASFRKMLGFSILKTAWRSTLAVALYYLMLFNLLLIGILVFAFFLIHKYQ